MLHTMKKKPPPGVKPFVDSKSRQGLMDAFVEELNSRLGCDVKLHRELYFHPIRQMNVISKYHLVFTQNVKGPLGDLKIGFTYQAKNPHEIKRVLAGLLDLLTQGFLKPGVVPHPDKGRGELFDSKPAIVNQTPPSYGTTKKPSND